MKILFVSHEKNMNGSTRSMINLIEKLKEEHQFYVLLPWGQGDTYDALISRNINVIVAEGYKEWIQPRSFQGSIKSNWYIKWFSYFLFRENRNKKIAKKIYSQIKELEIDLIHTNTSVIDLGARLSEIGGIPHVWHVREMGIDDFNLYPYIGWKKAYLYMEQHAKRIICISDAVYNKVTATIQKDKCVRIYNGVGKENLYPQRTYRTNCKFPFRILVAGNISMGKRQDVAIKAVQELHRRGHNNVELFIAGRGDISKLGINSDTLECYIHILGQVKGLNEFRHDMDVEVVCSACEAFGRVTVEAMMSGMPVVASASGGSLELIKDGENGYLFPMGDYYCLADKLECLMLDCSLCEKMGKNAIRYSKSRFSIDRCAEEIDILYSLVMGSDRQ